MIYTNNGHNKFVNQCFVHFSYPFGRFGGVCCFVSVSLVVPAVLVLTCTVRV